MGIIKQDYCILVMGNVRARALRCFIDDDTSVTGSVGGSVSGLDCSVYYLSTYIGSTRKTEYALTSNGTYLGDINKFNLYRTSVSQQAIRHQTTTLTTSSTQVATTSLRVYAGIFIVLVGPNGEKTIHIPAVFNRIPDDFTFIYPTGGELGYIVAPSSVSMDFALAINPSQWVYSDDVITEEITPADTDPYSQGGNSSIGGGTGTFSETGDIVGIPGLPTLSAVDTGFITLFNPTATQVKQLAAYMWSNSFDLATFKNIVANPIDCILGLTIVPVNPPDAGTKAVSVGNIPTDVNMPYLSSQYVEVDCGTLNVQEFWGSYLDYSPYTKMSLYLPYIGIVPLDIDDVMNATITIKYHVDVLSGACVAYVLCNGTQLYTYIGQCSSNVPITSNDFTNTVNGILGIAGSIGSLVATGGASAPTEIGKIAGNAINALKPNIQKSGAMSGTGGLMGVQTPYLICQRPRQSVPSSQNTFTGYPANITATLSDLSGYTEVDKIHLEGVPCTNEEMDEIMTLLESGVYI